MKTEILFEDKDILVIYKPAGMPTESASALVVDVVSELKGYLAKQNQDEKKKGEPYLGLIHRLDQPVEGLLVFAKNSKAASSLSRQIADRKLQKQYLAAVYIDANKKEQLLLDKEVVLTDYLVRDGRSNISKISSASDKRAKKAVLSYQVLFAEDTYAIVMIHLETGRHHQIRVQMAGAQMPLLGDRKYGSRDAEIIGEALGIRDVALCAFRLCFTHPTNGQKMDFKIKSRKPVFEKIAE